MLSQKCDYNQIHKLLKLLNIRLPLIQAPMAGGASTPELVASVSNSGALGSFAGGYLTPQDLQKYLRKIKTLTARPFATNLFIPQAYHATPQQILAAKHAVQAACLELNYIVSDITPPFIPLFDEQAEVLLAEKVPIFSFTFGIPSMDWIERFKQIGTVLIGTATNLPEAQILEDQGIDIIVAQGSEAGGHRGSFLQTENGLIARDQLLQLLAQQIKNPIVASGAIMDVDTIVSVIKKGSSGVQMGTAFLCCTESGIHPSYKQKLLQLDVADTTLTKAFSGKLARGLKNKFIARMVKEINILDYPLQNALTTGMRKEAAKQNATDFMSMWAGEAAHLCKEIPAAELINEISTALTSQLASFSI